MPNWTEPPDLEDDTASPGDDDTNRIADQFLIEHFSDRCGRNAIDRFRRERAEGRKAHPPAPSTVKAPQPPPVPRSAAVQLRRYVPVVALVALALLWLRPPRTDSRLRPLGIVHGQLRTDRGLPVTSAGTGDTVVCEGAKPIELTFAGVLSLRAYPGAAIRVAALDAQAVRLAQLKGSIAFDLRPEPRLPVVIELPGGASVRVIGTSWRIRIVEDRAEVAVGRGTVVVKTRTSEAQLGRGDRLSIDAEGKPGRIERFAALTDPDFGSDQNDFITGTAR